MGICERILTMTDIPPRTLAYWKQRQIDLRNCLAMSKPRSVYWAELSRAYIYATRTVQKIERRVLVP